MNPETYWKLKKRHDCEKPRDYEAKPSPGRVPRNVDERRAYLEFERRGWTVTKRGWPDLACFNNETGELVVVECKRNASVNLKESQEVILKALAKAGIRCYRFDSEKGFKRIR